MKNREKYAEEIKNYNGANFCKYFIQPVVLNREDCSAVTCERCAMLTALWLDEEYEEPEVDWSKVAVDTPILVRNTDNEEWNKRYFAHYENGIIYAWAGGCTSWTAYGNTTMCEFAKLADEGEE